MGPHRERRQGPHCLAGCGRSAGLRPFSAACARSSALTRANDARAAAVDAGNGGAGEGGGGGGGEAAGDDVLLAYELRLAPLNAN